jgi:D-3-phosphoglycerate dehydrogenase
VKLAILDDYQRLALASADWERLRRRGVEITAFHEAFASADEAAAKLAPFEIVCLMRERTAFPRELSARLPELRLVTLTGARAASLDSRALAERRIPVCHTRGGSGGASTAELTWGLIIAAARDLEKGLRAMRSGGWHEGVEAGAVLEGKRLGVIGLGKIGARVAAVGKAFRMEVVAWSRNLSDARAAEVGVKRATKEELLETCDVVTIHLVLSERTRGLIGASDLAKMKPTAVLVNTSRGPIVDEAALLEALGRGRPGHAALDVFEREPLPADHPLRGLDNVTLTPHLGYVSAENYRVFHQDTVECVEAWLDGRPVRVLNPEALA